MAASCSERRGSCGQKGTSGDDAATDWIAASTDVRGRLPTPVTAPDGAKGLRSICDGIAVDRTLRSGILNRITPYAPTATPRALGGVSFFRLSFSVWDARVTW